MRILKIMVASALAMPALAAAQVGPNPAVSGGSQDPTVGASTDSVTAPQDAQIGTPPRGNVLDTRADSGSDATVSDGGAAASSGASATATGPSQTTDPQTTPPPKRNRRR